MVLRCCRGSVERMTSTGVVNVVAVFTPLEGHRDEVMAAIEVAIPLVHDEPGCEL